MARQTADIDLKPGDTQRLNQEAAKAKILDAALAHLEAINVARIHFGLSFNLVWEE
ncbi:MAG: hypothetical protein ACREE2_03795 [Stellaceae bacterium]